MAYVPTKHGLRTRLYQLERFTPAHPLSKIDCIMLDGFCMCEQPEDCKHIPEEKMKNLCTKDEKHLKAKEAAFNERKKKRKPKI